MNCRKITFWLCLFLVLLQCTDDASSNDSYSKSIALVQLHSLPISTIKTLRKKQTGKLKNAELLPNYYNKTNLSIFPLPIIDNQLTYALEQQLKLLKRRKQNFSQKFGNISLNIVDLATTIELFLLWQRTFPQGLEEHLNAYQLKGSDGRGNIYFTGYYTPELKVKKHRNKHYKYPLYAYPKNWKGRLPSRKQIDGKGALKGHELELAYTQNLADIYYMQLQGSGLVRYPNGKRSYFGFAGSNRHPYNSIGRHIKNNENISLKNISVTGIKNFLQHNPTLVEPILFTNPSYVFFVPSNSSPKGAGQVPLTANYSIAVDVKHLPLGSCLLAALPVLDENGRFSHHKYQFVVAQDVGGAIRGSGHVDVYCGIGEKGQQKAMALHHYGQLWLLLPKPSDELGPVFSAGALTGNE